jgi:hypothetical protein
MRATIGLSFGTRLISCLLIGATCVLLGQVSTEAASGQQTQTAPSALSTIPARTILPVVRRSTISAEHASQGQTVRGGIAQDVPLPDGSRIRKGSRVEGQVVEVAAAGTGNGAKVSIRLDKIYANGQVISTKTDLRALAGYMEVKKAAEPLMGAGESEAYNWETTTQIGGDSVRHRRHCGQRAR